MNPFDVLAEEAIQEHKDSKTQKLLVGTIQNIDGNFVIVRLSDDVVNYPRINSGGLRWRQQGNG